MAPVIDALRQQQADFEVTVCAAGQHRELLAQTIAAFGYRVDVALESMTCSQSLSSLTGRLVTGLDSVVLETRPDVVLVQGDTTTAFVGSLVSYYHKCAVGHVEAGLRTRNRLAPFPEEINRRLVGVLADHHFAPTECARKALLEEGVEESRVLVTGNTVIDALLTAVERVRRSPPAMGRLEQVLRSGSTIILITGHRRENFGRGFEEICAALRDIAKAFPKVVLVYPVHLNPNVSGPVHSLLGGLRNIVLIPPLGYLEFVRLMDACRIILTDSGGIQEEAPSLSKPVLVMRSETERPEAVEAGTARLVGCSRDRIFSECARLLTDGDAYQSMVGLRNPYGDGKAASRISEYLRKVAH